MNLTLTGLGRPAGAASAAPTADEEADAGDLFAALVALAGAQVAPDLTGTPVTLVTGGEADGAEADPMVATDLRHGLPGAAAPDTETIVDLAPDPAQGEARAAAPTETVVPEAAVLPDEAAVPGEAGIPEEGAVPGEAVVPEEGAVPEEAAVPADPSDRLEGEDPSPGSADEQVADASRPAAVRNQQAVTETGSEAPADPADLADARDVAPEGRAVQPSSGAEVPSRAEAPASSAGTPATMTSPDSASEVSDIVPGTPVRTPLGARVVEQVAVSLGSLRNHGDGRHELTLRLDPPELGQVDATVELRDGSVLVRLRPWMQETVELLRAAITSLREALAQSGLQVTGVEIDLGGAHTGHPDDHAASGSEHGPPTDTPAADAAPTAPVRTDLGAAIDGGVDLLL